MRIEVNPGWHDELDAELLPRMDRLVGAIEADAKRYAPFDTGYLESRIDSYRAGPKLWRVHSHADYTTAVEYATQPHEIRPRAAKALYWPGAKHPVASVHHPGTPEQPFMRPALYQERAL